MKPKIIRLSITHCKGPYPVKKVSKVCIVLPNGKAGGEDGWLYEHVKYADAAVFTCLTDKFNAICKIEYIPTWLTTGLIVSLCNGKKKDHLDKKNYRGITFLSILGKVLERLMLHRMMVNLTTNEIPRPLQFAYQRDKGCCDA